MNTNLPPSPTFRLLRSHEFPRSGDWLASTSRGAKAAMADLLTAPNTVDPYTTYRSYWLRISGSHWSSSTVSGHRRVYRTSSHTLYFARERT